MKVILFNTPDGEYTIPLIYVAEHRAHHYAKANTEDFIAQVNFTMNDRYEGIAWLLNHTDFEDWEYVAEKVSNYKFITQDEFWSTSDDFEIIEESEIEDYIN